MIDVARPGIGVNGDGGFAPRPHPAARVAGRRLHRLATPTVGVLPEARQPTEGLPELIASLDEFKRLVRDAAEEANANNEVVSEETSASVRAHLRSMSVRFNEVAGDQCGKAESVRREIGRRVQTEMLPYILLTDTIKRFYTKPRGYAGDFYTIEMIYRNRPSGSGAVGKLIDSGFLEHSAACAVRNRRALLAREIQRTVVRQNGGPARVMSIACGPAREVFDVYEQLGNPARLKATLLDIDEKARDFVAEELRLKNLVEHVSFHNENVLYLAVGRRKLDLEPQDLIYSIGLIDYFNDKTVGRLIDYAYTLLKPGGKLILGNFHPRNADKALMDHVLEWRLIHRTEEDMDRLFLQSAFGRACTKIRFEREGVNLFAQCVKPGTSR